MKRLLFCTVFATALAACKYSSGFAYDMRYGSFISIGDNEWFDRSHVSFSFWIRPYTLTVVAAGIVGSTWDTGDFFERNEGFQFEGSTNELIWMCGSSFDNSLRTVVPLYEWTHVAGTFDSAMNGGESQLFKNGVLVGRRSGIGSSIHVRSPWYVGRFKCVECSSLSSSHFPSPDIHPKTRDDNEDIRYGGQIDEISAWNHSLSEAEVSSIWRTQLTGNEPGLLLYLTADGDNVTHAIDRSRFGHHGLLSPGPLENLSRFMYAADCRGCFNNTFPRCAPWNSSDVCGDNLVTAGEECEDVIDERCLSCTCMNNTIPRVNGCSAFDLHFTLFLFFPPAVSQTVTEEPTEWDCPTRNMIACAAVGSCTSCSCMKAQGADCLISYGCCFEDIIPIAIAAWPICLQLCAAEPEACYQFIALRASHFANRTQCEAAGYFWCNGYCTENSLNCPEMCGNGVLNPDEICDDGNNIDGDGCSGNCLVVTHGWICPTPGLLCETNCSDGTIAGSEVCDDGNNVDGDGCSGNCLHLEEGFECNTTVVPTLCTQILAEKGGFPVGAAVGIALGVTVCALLVATAIVGIMLRRAFLRVKAQGGKPKISLATLLRATPISEEEFDPSKSLFIAIEEFPVEISPLVARFGMDASARVPLGDPITDTITMSSRSRFHWKIICPKSPKYTLVATPGSGVIKPGKPTVVSLQCILHCTTAMSLKLPVLVSTKKSSAQKQHTFVLLQAESKLSTILDPEEIELIEPPIGDGSYGRVYRGTYRTQDVAVKVLKYQDLGEKAADFEREVHIMESLRSPFIITFVGAVVFPGRRALVTEFIPLGSLANLMKKQNLQYGLKVRSMYDCARGMAFLHYSKIMHRDLKPDNLLMASLDEQALVVAKLTDFGTTREVSDASRSYTTGVGTPIFMAPECLDSQSDEYSMAADVFSYGVMLYELATEKQPYSTEEFKKPWDIARFVIAGKRLPIPDSVPSDFSTLIEMCWAHKAVTRPTFEQVSSMLEDIIGKLHPDSAIAKAKKAQTIAPSSTTQISATQVGQPGTSSSDAPKPTTI